GTGEQWLEVFQSKVQSPKSKVKNALQFRFQYKGLYPAIEEASRLAPSLRVKLEHLVGEVDCSVCDGSRLRDDAAAVRFRGSTIGELGKLPLGELTKQIAGWNLSKNEQKIAGELLREITGRLQF